MNPDDWGMTVLQDDVQHRLQRESIPPEVIDVIIHMIAIGEAVRERTKRERENNETISNHVRVAERRLDMD